MSFDRTQWRKKKSSWDLLLLEFELGMESCHQDQAQCTDVQKYMKLVNTPHKTREITYQRLFDSLAR